MNYLGTIEWFHIELFTIYIYIYIYNNNNNNNNNRRWKNILDVIKAGCCWVALGSAVVVSSICYCIDLLVYNATPVARIIFLCLRGYCGLDGLRFLSQIMTYYIFPTMRRRVDMISYISWCTVSLEIVLCLCRRTVYVTFENMERLGSSSCVWGGDCLWCIAATIVRTSACEVDELWRRAAEYFPCEHEWRSCKAAHTEKTALHIVAKGHPPHTPTYAQSLQRYIIDSM